MNQNQLCHCNNIRALSVGEYIKIGSDEGEILGLVEKSSVTSAAFTDVRNFDGVQKVQRLQN